MDGLSAGRANSKASGVGEACEGSDRDGNDKTDRDFVPAGSVGQVDAEKEELHGRGKESAFDS